MKIKRLDIGKECLGMSNLNLSAILAEDNDQLVNLRTKLPKWTLVLNVTAFDEKELSLFDEDLRELGIEYANDKLKALLEVPNVEEILLKEFNLPNKLIAYRNHQEKCDVLPFYARKSRILQFDEEIIARAKQAGYPVQDLHGYVMPIEQARIFYIEYTIHSNSDDAEKYRKLFGEISEFIIDHGGIIDRPYGIWREMIYSKIPQYIQLLKEVKEILDPNHIFNPGKIIPMESE